MPGYASRIFVTSCAAAPQEIWRDYKRRTDVENRTAELRLDLGAGGFCMKQFFATETVFRCKGIASYAADMPAISQPPMEWTGAGCGW